jgi:valyl-tRNA synthetase
MDKSFIPQNIEQKWYQTWESKGYFSPQGKGEPYCIMLPPPNVTGSLHMGHGFQHSLMDALVRFKRMSGKLTLWQAGTDHAGISTQMVVERQLGEKDQKRTDFSRDAFVDKIWHWKETSGGTITAQMRRLGLSLDWEKERFTLDEGLSEAVQKVFVQLFDEGLIYRGERLVNWDPKLKTAISDLEVISVEEQGSLWHIRYPIKDSNESVVIATTRPETMLGDTAVAVSPEDERYQHLIGKEVALPLCDRTIPIIADEYVDKEFGSGCVKITPAHDFNDYEVGTRHQLPLINILNKDASLNDNVPKPYRELGRFDARKQILTDLEALGLLVRTEPHTLNVPRGEKSHEIIEPFLTKQWYVKTKPLAQPAIKAVKNGDIKFIPENWSNTYFQWMENIEDWCISRQLWWGHRIPAYYDEDGNIYVGYSEKDVRFKYQLSDNIVLKQDEDVLDTWFSSALWPFSTLGWPEKTNNLDTFYPTQVLVTGFDIIFFWVARMVMMGLKFMKKVPFKEVYITGLIRDFEGKKMSKSKGNVLDPLDIIDGISLNDLLNKRTQNLMLGSAKERIFKNTKKEFPQGIEPHGTDALRFTYCALATPGRNIRFDMSRVEGYRNFCNKIWNAARYVILNTEKANDDLGDGAFQYSSTDKWILSKLQSTIEKVNHYFASYRFDLLAQCLHEFVWHQYCDWYLELSKPVLYDVNSLPALKRGTRKTLLQVLESSLRLLHPIMPFITEEVWSKISTLAAKEGDTIMTQPFPVTNESLIDIENDIEIEWLKEAIQAVRTVRSEMTIPPSKTINILVQNGTEKELAFFERQKNLLASLAKIRTIRFLPPGEVPPAAATALVGKLEIHIPLEGLIDIDAEKARLEKELTKLRKDFDKADTKLNNRRFIDKAPMEVIEKETARRQKSKEAIQKLSAKLKLLPD